MNKIIIDDFNDLKIKENIQECSKNCKCSYSWCRMIYLRDISCKCKCCEVHNKCSFFNNTCSKELNKIENHKKLAKMI